jgi:hypothetical protein
MSAWSRAEVRSVLLALRVSMEAIEPRFGAGFAAALELAERQQALGMVLDGAWLAEVLESDDLSAQQLVPDPHRDLRAALRARLRRMAAEAAAVSASAASARPCPSACGSARVPTRRRADRAAALPQPCAQEAAPRCMRRPGALRQRCACERARRSAQRVRRPTVIVP